MKMLKTFAIAFVLAIAFSACVQVPAADDAGTDAGSQDASSCGNCSVDTNNPGTDTSSGAGEVAQQQPETSTPPCVDLDKDGYCDEGKAKGLPGDCNDNDPSINPGANEICGNGKDDNCNGQVDEGCATSPMNGNLTLKVSYPNSMVRVLNVEVDNNKSAINSAWDTSAQSTSDSVSLVRNVEIPGKCLYVRFNVTEGPSPGNDWLCYGHGSTATLDTQASIEIKLFDKVYTKSDVSVYSPPGGNDQGCSALFILSFGADCAL